MFSSPVDCVEHVRVVHDNETIASVSCSTRALIPTATPNFFTSQLTSPSRGCHCHIAPAVVSRLRALPTRNRQSLSPSAAMQDYKRIFLRSVGLRQDCYSPLEDRHALAKRFPPDVGAVYEL